MGLGGRGSEELNRVWGGDEIVDVIGAGVVMKIDLG